MLVLVTWYPLSILNSLSLYFHIFRELSTWCAFCFRELLPFFHFQTNEVASVCCCSMLLFMTLRVARWLPWGFNEFIYERQAGSRIQQFHTNVQNPSFIFYLTASPHLLHRLLSQPWVSRWHLLFLVTLSVIVRHVSPALVFSVMVTQHLVCLQAVWWHQALVLVP